MSDTVSIRFKGELLPGHSLDAVKAQAITLFKLTPENCNAFFSGREITLRKGLPTSELARYLERLHAAGLRVDIVPDAAVTPAASPAGTQPAVMPALAMTSGSAPSLATGPVSVPAPGADTVTCPRCQEVQPRRTLCRNCSLDIPGFLEAQAREQQEARAAAAAARDEARLGTHGAYDEEVSLASFSFEGRVGRRTYLVASVLSIALFVALGLWMLKAGVSTPWVAVTLISAILNIVWGFRMAALRLHDVGVTGWACLALLIPYVGAVAWLALLVWPGSKEGNDYGERSRPVNPLGVLGSILLTAILGAMLFSQFKAMGPEGIMELLQDSEFMEGDYEATNADDTDELDVFDGYDSSRNTLVMYSLSTCPYCAEKRQQFRAAGVRFTEYFIDTDERASEDFTARLQAHNIPSGSIGLPTIEINGVLLPNNPSLSKIAQHIRRPRS
ncbi:DUF805 domain-containing protein [Uliginosibacterium sp. H1]|uniref:DUF805 domain-containing protein n=1 Tax=Uliginosibacterium sp. H1 TaxID=3114757 RepID=UPI002E19771C|nr:DUF805 domain-containing protein [Uliginosibacterium sp. H1]